MAEAPLYNDIAAATPAGDGDLGGNLNVNASRVSLGEFVAQYNDRVADLSVPTDGSEDDLSLPEDNSSVGLGSPRSSVSSVAVGVGVGAGVGAGDADAHPESLLPLPRLPRGRSQIRRTAPAPPARNFTSFDSTTTNVRRRLGRRKRRRWLNARLVGCPVPPMGSIDEVDRELPPGGGGDGDVDPRSRPYPSLWSNPDIATSFRRGEDAALAAHRAERRRARPRVKSGWPAVQPKLRSELLRSFDRTEGSALITAAGVFGAAGVAAVGAGAGAGVGAGAAAGGDEPTTSDAGGAAHDVVGPAPFLFGLDRVVHRFGRSAAVGAALFDGEVAAALSGAVPSADATGARPTLTLSFADPYHRLLAHGVCQFYGVAAASVFNAGVGHKEVVMSIPPSVEPGSVRLLPQLALRSDIR